MSFLGIPLKWHIQFYDLEQTDSLGWQLKVKIAEKVDSFPLRKL